jgi:hypothetical protein
MNTPIIHRTPGTEEDGTPHIVVWTRVPGGHDVGIRVVQDGDEPVSEGRLAQAEALVRNTVRAGLPKLTKFEAGFLCGLLALSFKAKAEGGAA